ncbi:MAG: hypothetical protein AAGE94_12485 [Acidobacteriota bacterium]
MKRIAFASVLFAAIFLLLPASSSAQGSIGVCDCNSCVANPLADCYTYELGMYSVGPCSMYVCLFCSPVHCDPFEDPLPHGEGLIAWRPMTLADKILRSAEPALHEHQLQPVEGQRQPTPAKPDAVRVEPVVTTTI